MGGVSWWGCWAVCVGCLCGGMRVCVVAWWRVLVVCLVGVLGFDLKVCYCGVMPRCNVVGFVCGLGKRCVNICCAGCVCIVLLRRACVSNPA